MFFHKPLLKLIKIIFNIAVSGNCNSLGDCLSAFLRYYLVAVSADRQKPCGGNQPEPRSTDHVMYLAGGTFTTFKFGSAPFVVL